MEAVQALRAVDGSGGVFGGPPGIRYDLPRPAPVVMSAAAIEDGWPTKSRKSAGQDAQDFQRLSLAARLALAGDSVAKRYASDNELVIDAFPEVKASEIEAAIAEICDRYDADLTSTTRPSAPARTGLILRGLRIVGPLNIYNAEIPFPVRLIGCIVEDGIIADHCRLRSLDLSGSAIGGLSATFMDASGNVRLVRTVCLGPVDLGGAKIRGVLDFSDAVIFPFRPPPEGAAFAGERGVFNLSLAHIENECRLNRARIYGGLTMKGATVDRSMFMEDAMVFSPIATLTRMAFQWLLRGEAGSGEGMKYVPPPRSGLAKLIREEKNLPHVTALLYRRNSKEWNAETHGFPSLSMDPGRHRLLYRLLAESVRARTTAVRADGLTVLGSIFARRLYAAGRVRIRYADLNGSLSFNGAYLRSPRQSFDALEVLAKCVAVAPEPRLEQFARMAARSRVAALKRERGEGDNFALDLRDTKLKGGLDLGPMIVELPTAEPEYKAAITRIRPSHRRLTQKVDPDGRKTRILERTIVHGTIVANQADIGAGLNLSHLLFERSSDHGPSECIDLTHAHIGGDFSLFHAKRVVGIEASYARIDGSIFMHGPIQRMNRDRDNPSDRKGRREADIDVAVNRCDISGRLQMRSMVVGGDADLLFSSKETKAGRPPIVLNMRHSRIHGALSIYPTLAAKPPVGAGSRSIYEVNDDQPVKVFLSREEFADLLADADLRSKKPLPTPPPKGLRARIKGVFARLPKPSLNWSLFRFPNEKPPDRPRAHIDLRNVETNVLRHPPSAWPERDGLQITRLKYESGGTSGPLGIPYFARGDVERDPEVLDRVRRQSVRLTVLGLAGFLVMWSLEAVPWTAPLDQVGRVNLGVAWAGFWIWRALRHGRRNIHPNHSELKPLATFWLSLQRRRANPYKAGRSYYLPIEPYLVAANALRADGKLRSAEMVEIARARERGRTFSGRHHTLAKLVYWLLDRSAHFGFNIGRTIQWALVFVVAFAFIFEFADHAKCVAPADPGKPAPPFVSLAFSADAFLPLLGSDQTKQRVLIVPPAKEPPPGQPAPGNLPNPYICGTAIGLYWILKAIGLLFVTIVGASLAARTESFFSRIQQ